jgi:hypothetical protein|nr:MAG TPA: hypothetical protein [Caudoviricetes sp.]
MPIASALKQKTKVTSNGKSITKTFLCCNFCSSVYTVCYDNTKTKILKQTIKTRVEELNKITIPEQRVKKAKQIEKLQQMLEKENNRLCIMYEESELKKE